MITPVKDPSLQARFLSKVEMTDTCWIWIPVRGQDAYGVFDFALAHRKSYEIFIGPIPAGKILRHTCDRKSCVNPDHLIPGTYKENSADYFSRQYVRKERKPRAKSASIPVESHVYSDSVELRKQWRLEGLGRLNHGAIFRAGLQELRATLTSQKANLAHA